MLTPLLFAACAGPPETGPATDGPPVGDSGGGLDSATDTAGDTASPPERAYAVAVSEHGALELAIGDDRFRLSTAFSYPDGGLAWHRLGEEGSSGWEVTVSWPAEDRLEIAATGAQLSVLRQVTLEPDRLRIEDRLHNSSAQDIGLILRHELEPSAAPEAVHLAGQSQQVSGGSTNPTVLVELADSQLGTVALDAVSWAGFQAGAAGDGAWLGHPGIGLAPGATLEVAMAVYPMPAGDYWDFMNRARRDMAPELSIPAFEFGPSATVWDTRGALEPYLERREIAVGAALPFVDYDNSFVAELDDRELWRESYLENAERALSAIREVDPNMAVLTELEGIFYQLTLSESEALIELLPESERWDGYPKSLTKAQQAHLETLAPTVLDSMPVDSEGHGFYELYTRSGVQLVALMAYPVPGNSMEAVLADQVHFSLGEVGAAGFFLDGGGPANALVQSEGAWDGVTVEIDRQTGEIARYLEDHRLTTGPAIEALIGSTVDGGGVVVANGYAFSPELNAQPALRFMETGWLFDPLEVDADGRPQRVEAFAAGHLGSPAALGNVPGFYGAESRTAEFVMRDVIARLAHGLVYVPYNTEIPESGAGAGSYQALNAIFPLTPLSLHPGWIVGRERTVTALSGDYAWSGQGEPLAKCFDLEGFLAACEGVGLSGGPGDWVLSLVLDDWDQLAVIDEEAPPPVEPVAWWRMQSATSGSVTRLVDEVGERDLEQLVGSPRYGTDVPAGVPENTAATTGWDGASTGLFRPDPGFLDTEALTVELFYRRAAADSAGCLFGNGHVHDYAGISRICVDATGAVEVKLVGDSAGVSGNPADLLTFPGPDDTDWHHFALVWQQGIARGYLDRAQVGSDQATTHFQGRLFTDYAYLTVGFANDTTDSPGPFWEGDLDELRVVNRALEPWSFLGGP